MLHSYSFSLDNFISIFLLGAVEENHLVMEIVISGTYLEQLEL